MVDNHICMAEGPVQGRYAPSADWTLSAKMCPRMRSSSSGVRPDRRVGRCNTHAPWLWSCDRLMVV